MESYVMKRITYAASYELLKRIIIKQNLDRELLKELAVVMADCQVCDPLISHHCENSENP